MAGSTMISYFQFIDRVFVMNNKRPFVKVEYIRPGLMLFIHAIYNNVLNSGTLVLMV